MEFAGRYEDEAELQADLTNAFASVGSRSALESESFQNLVASIMTQRLGKTAFDAADALILLQDPDDLDAVSLAAYAQGNAYEWAETYGLSLTAEMVANWRRMVDEEVNNGLSVALAILSVLDDARATTISVTETTRAISMGEHVASALLINRGYGNLVPYWMTEPGACPICRPLHNKPPRYWRPLFPFGPGAHPHCRCYLDWRRR